MVFWTETNQRTGYKITKNGNFNYSAPVIDYITAVDDGVSLSMGMDNLNLPLKVHGHLDTGCLGETGLNIYGDVSANSVSIAGAIDISLSGTSPSVYICDSCLAVDISGLYIDMDFGALDFIDFLVNPIVNAIVGVFEGQIEAELSAAVREQVAPLLQDFLSGFEVATAIEIPAPINITEVYGQWSRPPVSL